MLAMGSFSFSREHTGTIAYSSSPNTGFIKSVNHQRF
jgi:hypothetical protein